MVFYLYIKFYRIYKTRYLKRGGLNYYVIILIMFISRQSISKCKIHNANYFDQILTKDLVRKNVFELCNYVINCKVYFICFKKLSLKNLV